MKFSKILRTHIGVIRKEEMHLMDTKSPLRNVTRNSHPEVTPWSSIQWKPTPWSELWVAPVKQHSVYIGEHHSISVYKVKLKIQMETHVLLATIFLTWDRRNKLRRSYDPLFVIFLNCACHQRHIFFFHFSNLFLTYISTSRRWQKITRVCS